MKINNSVLFLGGCAIAAIVGDISKNKILSRVSLFTLVVFGLYKTFAKPDSPVSPSSPNVLSDPALPPEEKTTFEVDDSLTSPFDETRIHGNTISITKKEKEKLCVISEFLGDIFRGGASESYTPSLEVTCPTRILFENICLTLEYSEDCELLRKEVEYLNNIRRSGKGYTPGRDHPLLEKRIKYNPYCIFDGKDVLYGRAYGSKKPFETQLATSMGNFEQVLERIQGAHEFGFYYAIARWEQVLINMRVHKNSKNMEGLVRLCNDYHLCSLATAIVYEAVGNKTNSNRDEDVENADVFNALMAIKGGRLCLFKTWLFLGKLGYDTFRHQLERVSVGETVFPEAEKANQLGIIEEQV